MRKVSPGWRRSWKLGLVILALFLSGVFFLKPILRTTGSFLVAKDREEPVEVMFVLGGSPDERGKAAVKYWKAGLVEQGLICTGGNYSSALKAYGIEANDSQMTESVLLREGVDKEEITLLDQSTSTFEEARDALNYCNSRGLKRIGVLSSNYHLRRVRMTFEDRFDDSDVHIVYFSADSEDYDPESWWTSEQSLLISFSEYVKLAYYLVKH